MELITKKIPRRIVPKLRRIQAHYLLRHHKRISEAEIIEKALKKLDERELEEEKRYALEDLFGFAKGGKKGNARKDVDEVVYGV